MSKSILLTLEDAEQEVQNAGGALSGVLRVSAPLFWHCSYVDGDGAVHAYTSRNSYRDGLK